MQYPDYPMIDPVATGQNIIRLRKQKVLTVKDLQVWFGFNDPKAIYKWQTGQSLPSIDNLYALSVLLNVPMDSILVGTARNTSVEPQADASGSIFHISIGSIRRRIQIPLHGFRWMHVNALILLKRSEKDIVR